MSDPATPPVLITAGEIARNFGHWQDVALTRPVVVTNHGRPRVALLSAARFAALQQTDRSSEEARKLASADRRVGAILDNITGAFIALDADLRIVSVNHALVVMTGLTAAELIGATWEDSFPDQRRVIAEQLRRTLRTGETAGFDVESVKPAGRIYNVCTFAYPGGVAALIRNRTEEREFRTTARRAEALNSALAHTPNVGVATLNVRGVFTDVDAGFARLTGFSLTDLTTAKLADLVRPSDRHTVTQALETALRTGGPTRVSALVLVRELSEQPFHISLAAIAHRAVPEGLIAVFSNLTPVVVHSAAAG